MAFNEQMRSLERDIATGAVSRSRLVLAAAKDLPSGVIRCTDEGRKCEFIPHAPPEQPTRAKSARVAHLQRRALCALVLSRDYAGVPARPLVEPYAGYPADFGGRA
jgi:hypothetical protein